jgi:hypothetical protein
VLRHNERSCKVDGGVVLNCEAICPSTLNIEKIFSSITSKGVIYKTFSKYRRYLKSNSNRLDIILAKIKVL